LTQSETLIVHKIQVKHEQQQFLRSSLALEINTVVMEMVSVRLYWLDETIFKLFLRGGATAMYVQDSDRLTYCHDQKIEGGGELPGGGQTSSDVSVILLSEWYYV
jgi:hypothetical protein